MAIYLIRTLIWALIITGIAWLVPVSFFWTLTAPVVGLVPVEYVLEAGLEFLGD